MTKIIIDPTILQTTMTLPVQTTTLEPDHGQGETGPVIAQASLSPSVTVSTIGTSFFTLTETATHAVTCTFFVSTGGDSSTIAGVCVGENGVFGFSPSASVYVGTVTESLTALMRPWTTVVFDATALPAAASTSAGQSNGGMGGPLTVSMTVYGLRLLYLFAMFGVMLGGAMVLH
jgi:hypothetical protein